VKVTLIATVAAFFISGCGFFGNTGEVRRQQSGKTVFKSAGEIEAATPAPQKVPGEKR